MDIHMPSIASSSPSPHNNGSQTNSGDAKEELLALMKEKDGVEAELKALGSVLDSVRLLVSGMRRRIHLHKYLAIRIRLLGLEKP